jgi:hypothetical protein
MSTTTLTAAGYSPLYGIKPGESLTIALTGATIIGNFKLFGGTSPHGLRDILGSVDIPEADDLDLSASVVNETKSTYFVRALAIDPDPTAETPVVVDGTITVTITEGEDTQKVLRRADNSPYMNINDSGVSFPEPVALSSGQGAWVKVALDDDVITAIATIAVPVTVLGTGVLEVAGQGFTVYDVVDEELTITANFKGTRACRISFAFQVDVATGADTIGVTVLVNDVANITLTKGAAVTALTPGFLRAEALVELSEGDVVTLQAFNADTDEDVTLLAADDGSNADATAAIFEHGYIKIEGVG